MTARHSLRRRLLYAGAAGSALAALLAALLLGAAFERSVLRGFDRRLEDDQLTLVGLLARDAAAGDVRLRRMPSDARYERPFSGHYWQVGRGAAALRSRSLWDFEPALPAVAAPSHAAVLELDGPAGQRLRARWQAVRLAGAPQPVDVLVAGDAAPVYAEIRAFRWLVAAAVAGLAALLLAASWAQVWFGLRPLQRIGLLLQRLRGGEQARIDTAPLVVEIRPLADHINALLDHQQRMVERGRGAAEDLAHAVKTPLAVLAAARGEDPAVMREVQRIRELLERQLARSRPVASQARSDVAAALAALRPMFAQLYPQRRVHVEAAPGIAFAGALEDLQEMLGNLLDNACKWADSDVRVHAGLESDRIRIVIDDDGPGVPEHRLSELPARGRRLDERVAGSGLGLNIVADLADSYGGALRVSNRDAGGLRAELELPAA